MVYQPELDGAMLDSAANDCSPRLRVQVVRTEAQAAVDRVARQLRAHILAMSGSGALDREIAAELLAKLDAVTGPIIATQERVR